MLYLLKSEAKVIVFLIRNFFGGNFFAIFFEYAVGAGCYLTYIYIWIESAGMEGTSRHLARTAIICAGCDFEGVYFCTAAGLKSVTHFSGALRFVADLQ
jgi:hypothetical protein